MTRERSCELNAGIGAAGHALDCQVCGALDSAGVAVALLDRDLRYVWAVNLRDAEGREPTVGATDRELFGAAGEAMMALQGQALATGSPVRGELRLTVAGEERGCELTATPQWAGDGTVTGLVCVMVMSPLPRSAEPFVPLADRRAGGGPGEAAASGEPVARPGRATPEVGLADEPRDSRDLLRIIFDGIEDGLLLLDQAGVVLLANNRFHELFAAQAGELVGRHWQAACAALGAAFPCEQVRASLDDGQARRERVRLAPGGGAVRIIDVHTLPLEAGGSSPDQLVVHVRDVTGQAQLEAQIIAAERFTANQHLAAAVAHEVNTPLQAIESCLHLAGKLGDAEQRGRYLRLAREEIQRVGHILRQLLDLYRPSTGVGAPISLNDLIERALLLVGTSLTRQGVVVVRDLAAELPLLQGRADELTQVLLNLIFNALQAMPRGGRLVLRTGCEPPDGQPRHVTLTISDNGTGIEAAALGRIFEPFFTTRPEGSGLGLAVSQRIVAAHGGTISVESIAGEGTIFRITLPLKPDGSPPAAGGLQV